MGSSYRSESTTAMEEEEIPISMTKLIDEVKKYQLIYDPDHSDYGDQSKKTEAWMKIAEALGVCSHIIGVLRARWINLRKTYSKNRKQALAEVNEDGELKPTWYYYNQMNFMDSYMVKEAQMSDEEDSNSEEEDEEENEEENEEEDEEGVDDVSMTESDAVKDEEEEEEEGEVEDEEGVDDVSMTESDAVKDDDEEEEEEEVSVSESDAIKEEIDVDEEFFANENKIKDEIDMDSEDFKNEDELRVFRDELMNIAKFEESIDDISPETENQGNIDSLIKDPMAFIVKDSVQDPDDKSIKKVSSPPPLRPLRPYFDPYELPQHVRPALSPTSYLGVQGQEQMPAHEKDSYGEYIATSLREMAVGTRSEAKSRITQILSELKEGGSKPHT